MNPEQAQTLAADMPPVCLAGRALWKMSGPDRVRYLNGQVTNDVVRLPEGQAWAAALTTSKGRLVADLMIAKSPDALWIDAPLERRDEVAARLDQYLIADDVVMEDLSEIMVLWHGFSTGVPEFSAGEAVFSSRRFGIAGCDVWQPKSAANGTTAGSMPEEETIKILRIEAALPLWGREMDETTLPPEAGMDRYAISYDKGCYVGQETMARIKSVGHVNRELVYLEAVDAAERKAPAPLLAEGREVGRLTSAAWSPRRQKWIALGIVSRQHARLGSRLDSPQGPLEVGDPPLKSTHCS